MWVHPHDMPPLLGMLCGTQMQRWTAEEMVRVCVVW